MGTACSRSNYLNKRPRLTQLKVEKIYAGRARNRNARGRTSNPVGILIGKLKESFGHLAHLWLSPLPPNHQLCPPFISIPFRCYISSSFRRRPRSSSTPSYFSSLFLSAHSETHGNLFDPCATLGCLRGEITHLQTSLLRVKIRSGRNDMLLRFRPADSDTGRCVFKMASHEETSAEEFPGLDRSDI